MGGSYWLTSLDGTDCQQVVLTGIGGPTDTWISFDSNGYWLAVQDTTGTVNMFDNVNQQSTNTPFCMASGSCASIRTDSTSQWAGGWLDTVASSPARYYYERQLQHDRQARVQDDQRP